MIRLSTWLELRLLAVEPAEDLLVVVVPVGAMMVGFKVFAEGFQCSKGLKS